MNTLGHHVLHLLALWRLTNWLASSSWLHGRGEHYTTSAHVPSSALTCAIQVLHSCSKVYQYLYKVGQSVNCLCEAWIHIRFVQHNLWITQSHALHVPNIYYDMKLLFGAHYIILKGQHRTNKGLQRTNITACGACSYSPLLLATITPLFYYCCAGILLSRKSITHVQLQMHTQQTEQYYKPASKRFLVAYAYVLLNQ